MKIDGLIAIHLQRENDDPDAQVWVGADKYIKITKCFSMYACVHSAKH